MKQNFAISAGHEETLRAAKEILKAGGNAIDAMIGAFVSSWISEPMMSGAGGGGFATIRTKAGKSFLFDFFCQTPKIKRPAQEIEFFPIKVDFGTATETFHIGNGSTAIPGAIAGIFDLHKHFGSMPMKVILQPAIALAKDGVAINAFQFLDFQLLADILKVAGTDAAMFFQEKQIKKIGQKIAFPQLADFLEQLHRSGKDAFYQGEIPQKIVKEHQEKGGFLTVADFEDYQTIIRKPLAFPFRNKTVLTNPLPSTGGTLMNLFLQEIESVTARNEGIASTNFHKYYEVFKKVNTLKKTPSALHNYLHNNSKRGATTHINILDNDGNAVSLTTSLGEGCGHFVEGTDIHLNNMLGEAALLPNGFHSWIPNTRLSSMMSPTIVVNEQHQSEIITGSGGAGRIPFAIAQTLRYLIDEQLPLEEAVNSGRFHLESGRMNMEKDFENFPDDLLDIPLKIWPDKSLYFGGVHSIQNKNGELSAVGDIRRDGVGFSGSQ